MAKVTGTDNLLIELKKSIDLLILIELCKGGANRNQVREIMGTADNNLVAKVRSALKSGIGE